MAPKRIVCLVVLAVVLAVGAAGVVVERHVDRRWQEMRQWLDRESARWEARSHLREPLVGEGRRGRAFEAYEAALDIARDPSKDDADLIRLFDAEPLSIERAAELRVAFAPAIEAMRRGARCRDATPSVGVFDGFPVQATGLLEARWLVNMTAVEVRALVHRGRHVEAVELALDAAQFASDLTHATLAVEQFIGAALVTIATRDTWPDERLAALDDTALERLADGLRALDGQLTRPQHYDDALVFANAIVARRHRDLPNMRFEAGWRHGFSDRWLIADTVLAIAHQLETANRAAGGVPWHERKRHLDALATNQHDVPFGGAYAASIGAADKNHRFALTSTRLLRMAVDAHRGGTPLGLEDPFTLEQLTVTETEDGWRVASTTGSGNNDVRVREVTRRRRN